MPTRHDATNTGGREPRPRLSVAGHDRLWLECGCFGGECRAATRRHRVFNISSVYRKADGYRFDFDYYLHRHMPRSIELLANAKGFKGVSVERGVELQDPKIESTFVAMCHYYFETLEDFMAAFMPHAAELQGDIVNYTNLEPTIQINEVVIAK